MRNNKLCLFMLILFGLMACSNTDNNNNVANDPNVFIDDSVLQLYIPVSILGSSEVGQQIFGHHGYALMEHYGYWFLNNQFKCNDIKVLYAENIGDYQDTISEAILNQLLLKEVRDVKIYEEVETFVSSDTIRVNGYKMGIVKKVVGCGDSALFVTSCFLAYPERNRLYHIIISCDKSKIGNMLRDSIPLILNSLYISKP